MPEFSVYEILNRKRRGAPLDSREIETFIDRYTRGEIPDYQMSALLMAIAINGMTAAEMATLTQSMLRSGEQWHLRDQYDFFADKHSTGGVGDKVSLVLSPWVAACGRHRSGGQEDLRIARCHRYGRIAAAHHGVDHV